MVGFYAETCPQLSEKLPSILTAERKTVDYDKRRRVLNYIDNGHLYGSVVGQAAWDPFTTPHSKLVDETKMLTDGKWVWPSSLTYFVRMYDILIPSEFVEHMEANSWIPPAPADDVNSHAPRALNEANDSQKNKSTPRSVDFGLLFSKCLSIEDVFEVAAARVTELLARLNLGDLNERELLDLASVLTSSLSPPKFVSVNEIVSDQQILADAKSTQLVDMLADQNKLPLSWDDKRVVWLKLERNEWKINIETWSDAFA